MSLDYPWGRRMAATCIGWFVWCVARAFFRLPDGLLALIFRG